MNAIISPLSWVQAETDGFTRSHWLKLWLRLLVFEVRGLLSPPALTEGLGSLTKSSVRTSSSFNYLCCKNTRLECQLYKKNLSDLFINSTSDHMNENKMTIEGIHMLFWPWWLKIGLCGIARLPVDGAVV